MTGLCIHLTPQHRLKFVSSEVRVWSLGGDLVYTLSGHTSFVYSLSVLPNGDVVSAGEDRTVRIWKGWICLILNPGPRVDLVQMENVLRQSFILPYLSGLSPRCRTVT